MLFFLCIVLVQGGEIISYHFLSGEVVWISNSCVGVVGTMLGVGHSIDMVKVLSVWGASKIRRIGILMRGICHLMHAVMMVFDEYRTHIDEMSVFNIEHSRACQILINRVRDIINGGRGIINIWGWCKWWCYYWGMMYGDQHILISSEIETMLCIMFVFHINRQEVVGS